MKISLREIHLVHNYLIENKLLSHISSPMTVSFTTDHVWFLSIQDYANQHHFTQDAVYIALVGMYFKLCVAKQKKEVWSSPLMTEINFARMDYEHLIKLLNKARDKFNKYSGKKFAYYPALYRQILELWLHLDHTVWRDQMAYYFGLWMEILSDIYFTAMKQKSEDKTYLTELEQASNDDETD